MDDAQYTQPPLKLSDTTLLLLPNFLSIIMIRHTPWTTPIMHTCHIIYCFRHTDEKELLKYSPDIDWGQVAYEQFNMERSPQECHLRYKNYDHPDLITHKWSKNEEKALLELVKKYNGNDSFVDTCTCRVGQYIDIMLYCNIKISIECNIFNYY